MANPIKYDQFFVDKKLDKPLTYHYNREERLALKRSTPLPPTGKRFSFFKNNLPFRMLTFSFLLVMLMLFGTQFLPKTGKATGTLAGFAIKLHTFQADDKVLGFVSFKITAPAIPITAQLAYVTFQLPSSDKAVIESVVLDAAGDKEIQVALPFHKGDKSIQAIVKIGAESLLLIKKL